MKEKNTYYNYDVDKLELSLPYIDGNGNVCTVSALYNVDHNILKQNFKENQNDNNPVILSYILHITDNTYNTHDIEYKLKFNKYPHTVLFTDDIDNITVYNNVDTVINCFSTYCVENKEIKTHIPTIYNFLNAYGNIITPPDSLYTQIDGTFSLPEYINGKKVSYTYLLNLNYIKLPKDTQQTILLLGPTSYYYDDKNFENIGYTFKPYNSIDERFLKKINVEKTNESLNFSIIPTNHYENTLYSYTLKNVSNICNINNLFKFKINNSYIYLSSYFSCKNYTLSKDNSTIIVPGFITKFTKNYLSKKYVIYEGSDYSNDDDDNIITNDQDNKIAYITQNLQHIQTNNNKVYKYYLQYNNNQYVYALSSTSYSLPKLITDNNIYYEYDNTYNTHTYFNTYISNFKIDNAYSINNINLHKKHELIEFDKNIIGYITYSYSYMIDNVLNISYQVNKNPYTYLLNTKLRIVNYNLDNTPIYSIYYNDETNNKINNVEILKNLLLDCFKIYVHYDYSIVLKNITNIFNIKYTFLISELEEKTENYWESLNINDYKFERLYEDDFLNILATKETFNKQVLLTLYDCYIISLSLNTNKNIISDIYIVIYNVLGIPNQYKTQKEFNTEENNNGTDNNTTYNYNITNDNNITQKEFNTEENNNGTDNNTTYNYNITNDNNIIYIEYSELLKLLEDNNIAKFNGVKGKNCILLSETYEITYKHGRGHINHIDISDEEYDEYKTKLYAYFNNTLSHNCNVSIENCWDENIIYTNGFYNLIYENFNNIRTYKNNVEYYENLTKLHKYRGSYDGISFSYNGTPYSNAYTYLTWSLDSNMLLSIKSTPYKKTGNFPPELNGNIRAQFNIEEYTFNYTYTVDNVSYNYTYTCLYKCEDLNTVSNPMDKYTGNNIVINTEIYEAISNLTTNSFYKKYIIDDNNVRSTINTFNYRDNIQDQFYRIYLNKLKYNDIIEYILPTNNYILKELYKTNTIIKFKQIIDNDTNMIISEFNEDFIKLTLQGLNVNLNRTYNIKTINNVNYIGNIEMFVELKDNDKYEIKLNKNYKLNTVILLYKYVQKNNVGFSNKEIYFYYINNKFYVVVDNLSNINSITVDYVDENDNVKNMIFNKIKKTDDIIKGLYQITTLFKRKIDYNVDSNSGGNPIPIRPTVDTNMYFINKPTPSINDNVILVKQTGDIIENWGKITNITYNQINNIDIVPLLYNEYDNGLSDDDKQLLFYGLKKCSNLVGNSNVILPIPR